MDSTAPTSILLYEALKLKMPASQLKMFWCNIRHLEYIVVQNANFLYTNKILTDILQLSVWLSQYSSGICPAKKDIIELRLVMRCNTVGNIYYTG